MTTNVKTAAGLALAAKYLGKELPFGIGSAVSGVSAVNRLFHKDYLGAGLDLGSAALSPWPGAATGIDLVNFTRDMLKPEHEGLKDQPKDNRFINPEEANNEQQAYRFINPENMKTASQFQQDLEDPAGGTTSDLYKAVAPLISSNEDHHLTGHDARRTKHLKEQVRQGLVGLEYMTGLKKNVGESFYDKHPTEAVLTDTLQHSVPIGAAVAGGGILTNYLRQMRNMGKTEPASMARANNPQDVTNAANLLNPAAKATEARGDISRLFGSIEENPQKRLELIDQLKGGDGPSFAAAHKDILGRHAQAVNEHSSSMAQLQAQLAATKDPEAHKHIESLMRAGGDTHKLHLSQLEQESKQLLAEAKKHPASAGLHKYVHLHEALRRAREKGGLQGNIGEGLKTLGGVQDLFEKYHVTGAQPHFSKELAKDLIHEYAGSHAKPEELSKFMSGALEDLSSPTHQSSGLRKAFARIKGPLGYGALAAAGGTGLYQLLKSMQNQNYSPAQTAEWKKTLLKSRGDFDSADRIDAEQRAAAGQ